MATGDYSRPTLETRFWLRVEKTPGCWNWIRPGTNGYGYLRRNGGPALAHRISWEFANGPIPDGLCVLHRCDNPKCVNPAHLFLGTMKDNTQDMVAKGRTAGQRRTHCKNGHAFTPENTLARRAGRGRRCRECTCKVTRECARRRQAQIKAARPTQDCAVCSKPFTPWARSQLTCGAECQQARTKTQRRAFYYSPKGQAYYNIRPKVLS